MKVLLLWTVLASTADGQTFLDAKVARGDDLRWADPAWDDSRWPTVRDRQSHAVADSASNRLWLRMRVAIPAGEPSVVLVYRCPCEVFLNGIKLGGTGNLNEPRPATARGLHAFDVPGGIQPGTALLAVRQYHPPGRDVSIPYWGARQVVRLVPRSGLLDTAAKAQAQDDVYPPRVVLYVLALGGLLAALAGARRDPTVLLLIGFSLSVITNIVVSWSTWGDQSGMTRVVLEILATSGLLLLLAFWRFSGPLSAKVLLAVALVFLSRVPNCVAILMTDAPWWTPWGLAAYSVGRAAVPVLGAFAVARGWKRGVPLYVLVSGYAAIVLGIVGRVTAASRIELFGVSIDTLASFVFTVMATAHVLRETHARRSEEQRLRTELESAQTVQEMLLSQKLPAGVDAVYLPASEVGGDFYQAFDTPSGRLVVAGDVSGKGLQAAMRVSTIIGALRNRQSDSPGAVLRELNRVLAGGPGFTTCCCALFPSHGPSRVANAGHPAPYADGREVALPGALPLGVDPDATYDEYDLPGEWVTLVSDGVIEAASAQGEFFGFERTEALSGRSARELAEAARAWGQNDDITVVTVRRHA